MSAKVYWRLTDSGLQSIHSVATGCSVSVQCDVCHCMAALRAAMSPHADLSDYPCPGRPIAWVTTTFKEKDGKVTVIVGAEDASYSLTPNQRKIVLAVFYIMYGWAESNGIRVDLNKCIKPSYTEHV